MIDVTEKREFLVWLINNISFRRREVIWILNYLINHETILKKCVFPDSWQNAQYLSVLEDNPEASWNDSVSEEIIREVEEHIAREEKEAKLRLLTNQINQALEKGEKEAFLELSNEINRLKMSICEDEVTK